MLLARLNHTHDRWLFNYNRTNGKEKSFNISTDSRLTGSPALDVTKENKKLKAFLKIKTREI
jgi:hypothetical protein